MLGVGMVHFEVCRRLGIVAVGDIVAVEETAAVGDIAADVWNMCFVQVGGTMFAYHSGQSFLSNTIFYFEFTSFFCIREVNFAHSAQIKPAVLLLP